MYTAALVLHSWMRWVVLGAALFAVIRVFQGRLGDKPWTSSVERASLLFTIAMDVQFLIGLVLYGALSPSSQAALADFAGAMRNTVLRFWGVEHPFGMVVALALVHVGRIRTKKATDDAGKYQGSTLFFLMALVIIVFSLPWPGMPTARPLFRW